MGTRNKSTVVSLSLYIYISTHTQAIFVWHLEHLSRTEKEHVLTFAFPYIGT